MRNRAFRAITTILSLLLLIGTPVKAGPIVISEVIQVLGSYQNAGQTPQLVFQDASQNTNGAKDRLSTGISEVNSLSASSRSSVGDAGSSVLGGILFAPGQPDGVEVSDLSDVEGSICDCGEIAIAGGFPKWPLLFLAGIPLFFIHHGDCVACTTHTPTPTPLSTPAPTPPPAVPEPASLLLFGSGLVAFAAGLRRRHAAALLKKEVKEGEEG